MGLRIGSTRPMPMNEMTQAKATDQTVLGWRHMSGRVPFGGEWWGRYAAALRGLQDLAERGVSPSHARARQLGGAARPPGRLEQTPEHVDGGLQVGKALPVQLVEQGSEHRDARLAEAVEPAAALDAQRDQARAGVVGICRALDQALRLEALDLGRDRRLGAVVGDGERAHPRGTELVEQGEEPGLGERQVEGGMTARPPGEAGRRAQQLVAEDDGGGHEGPGYIGNLCMSILSHHRRGSSGAGRVSARGRFACRQEASSGTPAPSGTATRRSTVVDRSARTRSGPPPTEAATLALSSHSPERMAVRRPPATAARTAWIMRSAVRSTSTVTSATASRLTVMLGCCDQWIPWSASATSSVTPGLVAVRRAASA